jgi:hypothetical protein
MHHNTFQLVVIIALLFVSACGGGDAANTGDTEKAHLQLNGTWWLVGHYGGDCGERGPWSGHLDILQLGRTLNVSSEDIGDEPSRETWLLDANNTVYEKSETIQDGTTETRTASTQFISSSYLEGERTLTLTDSKGSCTTTNHYTGIKLQTLPTDRFSGRHCLLTRSIPTLPELHDEMTALLQLDISVDGNAIRFTSYGGPVQFSGTGKLIDDKLLLSGKSANSMLLDVSLAFAGSSSEINGTLQFDLNDPGLPPSTGSVTGQQQVNCWRGLPDTAPSEGIVPMALDNVTGFQTFGPQVVGPDHDGIDFGFAGATVLSLQPVYASHAGIVTIVTTDSNWGDNIMHSVRINYNEDYYIAINFEPFSSDWAIADLQKENILVEVGQVLNQGDLIGYQIVPIGAEFPHVHWGIGSSASATTNCPADYLSESERNDLNIAIETLMGAGVTACQSP